jgi:hypothetical protein
MRVMAGISASVVGRIVGAVMADPNKKNAPASSRGVKFVGPFPVFSGGRP